jgi:hypothetical protein
MRSWQHVFAVGRSGRPQIGTGDHTSLPGCRCCHGEGRRTPFPRGLWAALPQTACLPASPVANLHLNPRRGLCAAEAGCRLDRVRRRKLSLPVASRERFWRKVVACSPWAYLRGTELAVFRRSGSGILLEKTKSHIGSSWIRSNHGLQSDPKGELLWRHKC